MATIPKSVTLTNSSVDVLNAIRNSSTINYQNHVPIATADADAVRNIGAIIMDYPQLQNEFVSALINRIGRVLITSKTYENPWSMFKKGLLEFGESVEEIFINLAKPFEFDPSVAENTIFKREIPDIKSAFHIMNYQKYYKVTISNDQLKQAFLSWEGVNDLISKTIESLYTAANFDEFQTMKYLLARTIIDGNMYPVQVPTIDDASLKNVVSTIKGVSNNFEFMSTKYNRVGVQTHTTKDDQIVIVNSDFDAAMDVEVLASAFNIGKAEFMGKRVLVDSFGALDDVRLALLFANTPTYTPITTAQKAALDEIPAILVDKNWFMIFDNLFNFTENYNGEGLYWNYWFHVWKTFSLSPFHNNALFIPGKPSVTSVTVAPPTGNIEKGARTQCTATVVTENFAPKSVVWSTTSNNGFSIDQNGLLTTADNASGNAIITATSTYDPTKKGTANYTIG